MRNIRLKETIRDAKGYVKFLAITFILILVAAFITSLISFIPEMGHGEPGYDDYITLTTRTLPGVSTLLTQIGIALFSFAASIGAITDESLTKEVRTGLAIAASIGIIAIVILTKLVI